MKLTGQHVAEMVRLHDDGHSIPEIAYMLGINGAEVKRRILHAQSKAAHSVRAERQLEQIKELHAQGVSVTEIANRLKCCTRTVRDKLAILGLRQVQYRRTGAPKDKRCSKEGTESNAKSANDIISELRADIAVLERRKSFRWFQEIDQVHEVGKKRSALVRVVNTGEELRLVIELRGVATEDSDGVVQRSFTLNQVEMALESLLNFIAPPVR
jgi:DNA-binding CsgD family transcriptional regulator